MGLKYADLCTNCGKMRTRHPSGLCCRCRKKPLQTSCVVCGRRTMRGGKYCYNCRKLLKVRRDLDAAINEQQKRLMILKLRKEGMSFRKIGEAVGIAKSMVFTAYTDMMRLPIDISPESVDILDHQKSEDE